MNSLPIETPEVQDRLKRIAYGEVCVEQFMRDDLFQEISLYYVKLQAAHPEWSQGGIISFCRKNAVRWARYRTFHTGHNSVDGPLGKMQSAPFDVENETEEETLGRLLPKSNPWRCQEAKDFFRSMRGLVSSGALAVLLCLHEGMTNPEILKKLKHSTRWLMERKQELQVAYWLLSEEQP